MGDRVQELTEDLDLNCTTRLTVSYLALTTNKVENDELPGFLMPPKTLELHHLQGETILLVRIKICETTQNEDGFWEYSSIKPSLYFVDLNTVACIIDCVLDWGVGCLLMGADPQRTRRQRAQPYYLRTPTSPASQHLTNQTPNWNSHYSVCKMGVLMDLYISSTKSSE